MEVTKNEFEAHVWHVTAYQTGRYTINQVLCVIPIRLNTTLEFTVDEQFNTLPVFDRRSCTVCISVLVSGEMGETRHVNIATELEFNYHDFDLTQN